MDLYNTPGPSFGKTYWTTSNWIKICDTNDYVTIKILLMLLNKSVTLKRAQNTKQNNTVSF